MKNLFYVLTAMFLFVGSMTLSAQDASTDFFAGKWELLVEGTPAGDGKMVVELERKDGKLTGKIIDKEKNLTSNITRVEEKAKYVTLYYTSASGYEVYVFMEKKGDNKVVGSVMDMFDLTGKRLQE